MMNLSPKAWPRLISALLLTVGVFVSINLQDLCILYLCLVAYLIGLGLFSVHKAFLLNIWLPVFLGLFVLWGFILKTSPLDNQGSGIGVGVDFAFLIGIRLLIYAAIFQITFLSIKGFERARFLVSIGLSVTLVAMILSVINLWPYFQRKSARLVAARCARGLMPNRHIWTRLRQIPQTFRILFVGSLDESFDRVHRWESEGLLNRLDMNLRESRDSQGSVLASFAWLSIAIGWVIWIFLNR